MAVRSADMGTAVTLEVRVPEGSSGGVPGSAGFRPTALMGRVSAWLAMNGPASVNDIKAAVNGRKQWVGEAVRRLVDEGYADKGPAGVSHVRLFGGSESEEREDMKDDF